MSVHLLDKTRKINKLLHNINTDKIVFDDICDVLSGILDSNVIVISKKGKVLGLKNKNDTKVIDKLISNDVGKKIDLLLNERFLNITK